MSIIDEDFIYLFHEGRNYKTYSGLGAHICKEGGVEGVRFSVWAPGARKVNLAGDFNNWQGDLNPMEKIKNSAIWTTFVPGIGKGELYKYQIYTGTGKLIYKADPYAFYSELRPGTASRVYPLNSYQWNDEKWMEKRKREAYYDKPVLIYELHPGSWRRDKSGNFLDFRQLADELAVYLKEMGYTHLELLPITEHPFDGSWGYQTTGYFSVTSRYGSPDDFKYFVDILHQNEIAVILDWVPSHFCVDDHGLAQFDGTCLYEPADPSLAYNEWSSLNFDFGKKEVLSFLLSNAYYWFDIFHIDGLRVDAVSNLLYLKGRENKAAIEFLKDLNKIIFKSFPGVMMIAEDSTNWPLVTYPVDVGGLGFNFKWNMGWMNDLLEYIEKDPVYRKYHHHQLTFSFMYMYSENFVLPLSHDEVVHGKKSLLNKMPGDYWQKFAGLRCLYAYMMAHPGKKMLFMGAEFGQFIEWDYQKELDWFLLDFPMHKKLHEYVRDLNHFYLKSPSLWDADYRTEGFEWIDADNNEQSILVFIRRSVTEDRYLIVLSNFTPVVYRNFRIGVPENTYYREVFNSDEERYGGSGVRNPDNIKVCDKPWHNRSFSIKIDVPPLATIFLSPKKDKDIKEKN
ncbi:MAG: 1,4-alpha-glucan branching protein GlgB [Halanaerobiaceae bacterium]|nr:1,4-alpha-glucan branching protein GlgB [Halanaerobiaceae bacterium]